VPDVGPTVGGAFPHRHFNGPELVEAARLLHTQPGGFRSFFLFFKLLMGSTIWGVCFSLKANPSGANLNGFDTVRVAYASRRWRRTNFAGNARRILIGRDRARDAAVIGALRLTQP
jgi:hypothetical protein